MGRAHEALGPFIGDEGKPNIGSACTVFHPRRLHLVFVFSTSYRERTWKRIPRRFGERYT